VTSGSQPARTPDDAEPDAADDQQTDPPRDTAGQRKGRRRRETVADVVDEDPTSLQGEIELMTGAGEWLRKVILRGGEITAQGGPIRNVVEIAGRIDAMLRELMPTADPYMRALDAGNSMTLVVYAPQEEIAAAAARSSGQSHGDDGATDARPADGDPHEQIHRLPDTAVAMVALAHVMSRPDAAAAATTARAISAASADELRKLTTVLVDHQVQLDLAEIRPDTVLTVERAQAIMERLDAAAEQPPVPAEVVGVLEGAHSGKRTFQLAPDAGAQLHPALGPHYAGRIIKGTMSSHAYAQIREHNLWSADVRARLKVTRSRRGTTSRLEGVHMTSVQPRYR
jgi:hypothetical protein